MYLYRLLKNNFELVYFVSLLLLVVSLPLSRFGLSVAQFSILGIWLIEGRYKEKVMSLFKNKAALVLISFYFLHLIGLIYTTDFEFGLKDIRVKLPLLFFPVIFVTSWPFSIKKTNQILLVYFAAVLVASLISLGIFIFGNVTDFRQLSPFISHIRLSLNVCLAIFFAGYFGLVVFKNNTIIQLLFLLIVIWLAVFLVMIESITGFVILFITGYLLLISALFIVKNLNLKLSILIVILGVLFSFGMYVDHTINKFLNPHLNSLENLDEKTPNGNFYVHDTINLPVENGSYVGLYMCEEELRSEWNKRSEFYFTGKDNRGQEVKYTLIRYLNSKNLRKDADGVRLLSDEDISFVENGIANYNYTKPLSINSRFYKLLWEYQIFKQNGNPGGHSFTQRFEFWRVSLAIIKHNFWTGVGTGDIKKAYADMYENLESVLQPQWRHRAHNQFLAVFVTFGVFGFIWFLISLFYPSIYLGKFFDYKYFVFWLLRSLAWGFLYLGM